MCIFQILAGKSEEEKKRLASELFWLSQEVERAIANCEVAHDWKIMDRYRSTKQCQRCGIVSVNIEELMQEGEKNE